MSHQEKQLVVMQFTYKMESWLGWKWESATPHYSNSINQIKKNNHSNYIKNISTYSTLIVPERSEGLLFHQTLDFHRMLTTTEIPVQRRPNGSILRPLPSKSVFGDSFRHVRCQGIRGYKSRNRSEKKLGLCYLATLKSKFLILVEVRFD